MRPPWLVFADSRVWAAALRMSVRPDGARAVGRLREFRRPADVVDALRLEPASLIAVEFGADNLAARLRWLPLTLRRFPAARAVALVDRALRRGRLEDLPPELTIALHEAGVAEIATSPRGLAGIIEVSVRHRLQSVAGDAPEDLLGLTSKLSITLPWQSADGQLG